MNLKLIIIQFFGGLFFVKAFDTFEYLIFDKDSLEVFRTQSYFSFFSGLTGMSHKLFFITAPGLLGLLLASVIAGYINKKLSYKQNLLLVAFLLVFLLNKLFFDIPHLINFRSEYLSKYSVKLLLTIAMFAGVIFGLGILQLARHLKTLDYYLKFHN